ncbi:MAG: transposase [Chloroflexi bacterium]|nr:transposase [Chloroflexota bacterium]
MRIYPYHVFALCHMLGFRFAPRIRSVAQKYLSWPKPFC